MAITEDDQWEWRSFKVGDGTSYSVVRWDPGNPEARESSFPRVGADGSVLSRSDLLGPRRPSLELEVEGSSRADLQTKLDALHAATIPLAAGDEALLFQILGTTRRINCRPRPAKWLWTEEGDLGLLVAGVDVDFYAQDPRVYNSTGTVTVLA